MNSNLNLKGQIESLFIQIGHQYLFLQQIKTMLRIINLQSFYYKMKIKFIPKKERQAIKLQKQTNSNNQSQILNNANAQRLNQRSEQKRQKDPNLFQISHKHIDKVKMDAQQEDIKEQRHRSRDFRGQSKITKQQIDQREQFKKKYLGLLKMQKSNRLTDKYKNTLNFQWDDKDDTFIDSGYLGISISQANAKFGLKHKDKIQKQIMKTWREKAFQQMTERDWRIFRQDNQIYIKGGRVPNPFRQWLQLPSLDPLVLANLAHLNFIKPRPIQMQAIPIGCSKKDLMAIAPTGQGKTLAYLLPIINFVLPLQKINGLNSDKGPYALILVPSRQLAQQIQTQFSKISKNLQISALTMVGGRQIQIQSINLTKGAELIIGTPGRIKQLIEKRHLSLQRLSWVVIDQADKMISQNLVQQVQYILNNSGSESVLQEQIQRQKIIHMFSATMVPEIQKLGKTYLMPNASYITIGEPGGGKKQIDQFVQLIDEYSKGQHIDFILSQRLGKILKNLPGPIIIFVNERQKCQKLVTKIQQRWKRTVADYHGGKNQEARQRIISNFRAGKFEILVATDLAGRGLDVKGINAVINYDAPKNISEFIHRSGRTGRAGMKGKCFTFLTSSDQNIFYDVRVFLQRNQFKIPQNLKQHPGAQVKPGTVLSVPRRKQIVYTN